jgi:hypothetical protein
MCNGMRSALTYGTYARNAIRSRQGGRAGRPPVRFDFGGIVICIRRGPREYHS